MSRRRPGKTLSLEVIGTFPLTALWSKLKASCKLCFKVAMKGRQLCTRGKSSEASRQLSDLACILHVKEQLGCLGECSKWAQVRSPCLAWNEVLPNWMRIEGSDGVWATDHTRVRYSPRKAHQYTPSQLFSAYNRALPDAPANQNGSWFLSPLSKSLAVLSVIGLAVCCQPWIFCGDWDCFCYRNGTHNENIVYFSVQYGSVDHLPWPHRH